MESDLGKLFIGGISWDTDEERLNEYFTKYGEVVEAVIMRDRATGRARGFGFVVFADPAVAGRVIMDKHVIDGRTVNDQHILNRNISTNSPGPGRTKKIFVGGLASTVTETDFKNYFEQYGNITDVVVMYDHNTQRPRGFGFITYDSEEAVDRVLHKTFHELNGKMVEVKRAVPKELSPGLSRSPLMGYGYGLNRPSSFLNAYAQGYNNMNSIGEFGMRVDGRFNPLPNNRSGFSPFGTTGYGMGVNLEPGLSPTYNGGSNFGSSPVYGRMLSPYSNRYNTPVGYSAGSARNDPALSITSRNVWGNSSNTGAFVGSGSGVFGGSLGNRGGSWGPSSVSAQVGGNASAYNNSTSVGYGSGGGTAGYGRNVGLNVAPSSSFDGVNANYEGSYGDFYRSNSVYGDSTWRSPTPELDGSGSLGYGLGSIGSDATVKTSEGYIGSYGVTNRQPNRGTTF
ncbi:Heterogeneous nuclear ribonucleoprotein 1 [Linum perenne]